MYLQVIAYLPRALLKRDIENYLDKGLSSPTHFNALYLFMQARIKSIMYHLPQQTARKATLNTPLTQDGVVLGTIY